MILVLNSSPARERRSTPGTVVGGEGGSRGRGSGNRGARAADRACAHGAEKTVAGCREGPEHPPDIALYKTKAGEPASRSLTGFREGSLNALVVTDLGPGTDGACPSAAHPGASRDPAPMGTGFRRCERARPAPLGTRFKAGRPPPRFEAALRLGPSPRGGGETRPPLRSSRRKPGSSRRISPPGHRLAPV